MGDSGMRALPQPSRMVMTETGVRLDVNPEWEVHPAWLKGEMEGKAEMLVLDVRMRNEWEFTRLEGATLIPLGQLQQRAGAELGAWKNKRVIVYCHHGVRSLNATIYLRQQGFADVKSMAGGIDAWSVLVDAGVPRY